MNIFSITADGIKHEAIEEKTYFIIDAKEFLQSVFDEVIKEQNSFGVELEQLAENAISLLKAEYIITSKGPDLITIFSTINKKDIEGNENLLKAREQSLTLKQLLETTSLNEANKRIISLAYFNDSNLESIIDQEINAKEFERFEKLSVGFKKKTTSFFKGLNKNLSKLNEELLKAQQAQNGKLYESIFDEIIKNISTKAIVQKAYKSCQSLIRTEKQNKLFFPSQQKNNNSSSSFGDK